MLSVVFFIESSGFPSKRDVSYMMTVSSSGSGAANLGAPTSIANRSFGPCSAPGGGPPPSSFTSSAASPTCAGGWRERAAEGREEEERGVRVERVEGVERNENL